MNKNIHFKSEVSYRRLKISEYNIFKKYLINFYYKSHILAKSKSSNVWQQMLILQYSEMCQRRYKICGIKF